MQGVDLALAVLPRWVGPATVILPVIVGLLVGWGSGSILALVGGRGRRRLGPDSHWTERAAAIWPARVGLGFATILAPVGVAALASVHLSALSPAPTWLRVAAVGAAAMAGALLAARPVRRWLGFSPRPLGESARSALVQGVVRWGAVSLVALAALLIPVDATPLRIAATVVLALFPAVALAGLPLTVLAAVGLAEPPDERLRRVAAEAAGEGAPPRLYVVPGELPNAFAFPLGRRVMIPAPTLSLLDDDELRAVLAHEIAHLREPLPVLLSRLAGGWALLPVVWLRPAVAAAGSGGLLFLVASVVLVLVALTAVRRVARRMEVRADTHGHAADLDGAYARGLEKIYRAGMIPAVMGPRNVHPSLYDRLVAAGAPPPWPRPAPPSLGPVRAAFFVGVVGAALGGGMAPALLPLLIPADASSVSVARIALGAGTAADLAALADAALADDALADAALADDALADDALAGDALAGDTGPAGPDVPRAETLLAAAAALDPYEVLWPARLASLYASTGDCLGAVRALRTASATRASVEAWDAEQEGFTAPPLPPEYAAATESVSRCLGTPAWGVDQGAPGFPPG